MRIPTDRIDEDALIRDRTHLDPAAMAELQASIAANGLRLPIEVTPTQGGYALISGYRRLHAIRELHRLTGDPAYAQVQAIVREGLTQAQALAAMVEENEQRQPLSPWERARIAQSATTHGPFTTLDEVISALYPQASRQKRANMRSIAEATEALPDLIDPELMTERQLLRLSGTLRLGWEDLITTALTESRAPTAAAQWDILHPILTEAESLVSAHRPTHPTRPRRLSRPRPDLTIRRERTRTGYVLHITGSGASDVVVGEVLDEIERIFGPA